MKCMYQSTLHSTSAHGAPGDNGVDDDGNSNRPSHCCPEGNEPRPLQNGIGGNSNCRPANNGGNGGGRHPSQIVAGPPGPPDGEDDSDDKSDGPSSHSYN